MPYYYHAKIGGNWTTNNGETEGGGHNLSQSQSVTICLMVPKYPSLNRVKKALDEIHGQTLQILRIFLDIRNIKFFNEI